MRLMILSQLPKFLNFTKFNKIKTDAIMKYTAPEFDIYEVIAERGYGDSVTLPGFEVDPDELTF